MTPEALDIFLKILTMISMVGGAGFVLFKMGRMMERFEQGQEIQTREITALKTGFDKIENLMLTLADQKGRMDRYDDRLGAQGRRLDEGLAWLERTASQVARINEMLARMDGIVHGGT